MTRFEQTVDCLGPSVLQVSTRTGTHVSDRTFGDTAILVTFLLVTKIFKTENDLSGKIFGFVGFSYDRCDVNRVQK